MSTNAVRQRMTHRARIERNTQASVDGYGASASPEWTTHIAAQPCFLYVETRTQTDERELRGVTVLEEMRMIVPNGADITERDRVNGVTKRDGTVVYGEVMQINSVTPHHDHLEVRLKGVV